MLKRRSCNQLERPERGLHGCTYPYPIFQQLAIPCMDSNEKPFSSFYMHGVFSTCKFFQGFCALDIIAMQQVKQ